MTRLSVFLFCILWLTGCSKEDRIAFVLSPPKQGDVYVAGIVDDKAILWKNGIEQYLTANTDKSTALSVFVSAADVYVAGKISNKAVLWKNGVVKNLSDDGVANSVFVAGDDVFVAGIIGNSAVLWKNGVVQNLSDGALEAEAKSVYIFDKDVYVVGSKLWKNGVVQKLADGTEHPGGSSVFVASDDVYVAGTNRGAVVLKNGIEQRLIDGYMHSASAISIFVSGNDVYVTGSSDSRDGYRGYLWKNGEDIYSASETFINSVYVTGDDVYIVGGGIPISAILWKNNEANLLTKGNNGFAATRAFSIFVVE